MELLNRLTLKNLKLNKKRTLVTIIGIVLATALITGVATLISSFQKSILEFEKQTSGDYHYSFKNVPGEDLKYIENNRNVENVFVTCGIGYSKLDEAKNEYKPYIYVSAFSKEAMGKLGLELFDGRLPENENEIVMPRHLKTNGQVDFKIGEEITLNIGKRLADGYELNQGNPYNLNDEESEEMIEHEEFKEEFQKTYKIVGIIERPNMNVENYSAPGYTAITYLGQKPANKKLDVYARYKDLKKQNETTETILGIEKGTIDRIENGKEDINFEDLQAVKNAKYELNKNMSVIQWENAEFGEGTTNMLLTVAGVIIGIIIVTSVFCIRNSFAISITEKTKQYGMLASIGATPKQIRKNVLYEGFMLGVIGIPLGIVSGLGAIFILLKVVENLLKDILNIKLIFATNLIAILISVLLGIITIYLSAKKSARRASKISPIEAIRSTQDIKIKSKKVRSPKIIKKLFGIGGDLSYKNLKRNNKKYRTTVISIVVSVSIFIAMTSFMNYAFKVTSVYYTYFKYNFSIMSEDVERDYNDLIAIAKNEEVKSYSILRRLPAKVETKELSEHYSEEKIEYSYGSKDDIKENSIELNLTSLGDEEYKRFIKAEGLKYDEVKDKIILIDDAQEYNTINGKSSYKVYRIYDYKKGDKIPLEIEEGKTINVEIAKVTTERPMGCENYYNSFGTFIVSDEFMQKYENVDKYVSMYMDVEDAGKLEEYIDKTYTNNDFHINNMQAMINAERSMWLVISIFIYGFMTVISLIGVTNIFNTITTNMELRQKEFANLKSIGMTQKEFNRMIRLESIFYGTKSLLIGVPIGLVLSYYIYKAFGVNLEAGYIFPTSGVVISILAVAILIGSIMRFSK